MAPTKDTSLLLGHDLEHRHAPTARGRSRAHSTGHSAIFLHSEGYWANCACIAEPSLVANQNTALLIRPSTPPEILIGSQGNRIVESMENADTRDRQ